MGEHTEDRTQTRNGGLLDSLCHSDKSQSDEEESAFAASFVALVLVPAILLPPPQLRPTSDEPVQMSFSRRVLCQSSAFVFENRVQADFLGVPELDQSLTVKTADKGMETSKPTTTQLITKNPSPGAPPASTVCAGIASAPTTKPTKIPNTEPKNIVAIAFTILMPLPQPLSVLIVPLISPNSKVIGRPVSISRGTLSPDRYPPQKF